DDLVSSAVTFLQDPKVADAPLAKRIAFLESKGLSPQQVQQALQRAQDAAPPAATGASQESTGYAPARPPTLPYASYAQGQAGNSLIAAQPPALPQRDWRDWFIMAVVSGGLSWAVYHTAKRYILPLVQPPNISQLEEDKNALAAQFDQVQEMLSMLQTDAAEQKQAMTTQQEKVDKCLKEVETTVEDVRDKADRRETDIRRLGLELDQIRELIPKALESVKHAQTESLNELNNELRSLKTLLQNR
ncbi:peroxisomal membrane anchor protein conserved region-domain-containing protein, partial [Protomyces lactucae-debilis]